MQPLIFKSRSSHCQSCGMPLSKDEKGGGTETDGTKSLKFCSHCYQSGTFTEPHISVDEMQQKVYRKLKEMHFPGFFARMLTNNIPKLERWRTIEKNKNI